jgi:recombination protein RecR
MLPEIFKKLIDYFASLPGVGPRQATRFAFNLLNRPEADSKEFSDILSEFRKKISQCQQCCFLAEKSKDGLCEICANSKRNQTVICVVEKETDVINLEKTKIFDGVYHILGSAVLKSRDGQSPFRLNELIERVKKLIKKDNIEIILALNHTTEGEATANYIKQELVKLKIQDSRFKISKLGRGLATGNELEYADTDTLKSALERRE